MSYWRKSLTLQLFQYLLCSCLLPTFLPCHKWLSSGHCFTAITLAFIVTKLEILVINFEKIFVFLKSKDCSRTSRIHGQLHISRVHYQRRNIGWTSTTGYMVYAGHSQDIYFATMYTQIQEVVPLDQKSY